MPPGKQPAVELMVERFGGVNNTLQFSQLFKLFGGEKSPKMQNAYMKSVGSLTRRPGTRPLTASPLTETIEYLTTYKASASASSQPEIYAASGTTLYKFNGTNTLTALTMTNPLHSADIYTEGFTNSALTSRLVIGDGKSLKQCDGTTVSNITPAPNKPSPNPANVLANVNTKGCKFIWEYSGHIFISPGTNEMFFTDRFTFDYIPETQYYFLINDNDYINGAGVVYDGRCLVPMRRGWGIITGTTFDNFKANEFLNTNHGVIAPRSITKVTYPNGSQAIIYLSDSSVHEVFTSIQNDSSKLYATRDLMANKISFHKLELTEEEKKAAVGHFDVERSLYLLSFKKSGVNYTYAYDLRNEEWYPNWLNFNAKSYVSLDSVSYFAGEAKHLCKLDDSLYSDWQDAAMTVREPIHFKRYSPLLSFEQTGYPSYWDYYILELKQYDRPSSVDVTIIFANDSEAGAYSLDTSEFIWDVSEWDHSYWSNNEYTETVNEPRRMRYMKKSKYIQELWENDRDEPLEIYWSKWIGRTSGA